MAGREREDLLRHWFAGEGDANECVVEKLRKEGSCSVDADGTGGRGRNDSILYCKLLA